MADMERASSEPAEENVHPPVEGQKYAAYESIPRAFLEAVGPGYPSYEPLTVS